MELTLDQIAQRPHAPEARSASAVKAIILAAGSQALATNGGPLVLQKLGDSTVLDCVVQNALQVVPPEEIYVVVGYCQEEVREHLGTRLNYVVQEDQRGTGHAVLQALPLLQDYRGDLLILYGDTPLFRPASIRGLLNRHRLRRAHLTLLTAVVDRPLPYGRIIRDAAGRSSTSSRRPRRLPKSARSAN